MIRTVRRLLCSVQKERNPLQSLFWKAADQTRCCSRQALCSRICTSKVPCIVHKASRVSSTLGRSKVRYLKASVDDFQVRHIIVLHLPIKLSFRSSCAFPGLPLDSQAGPNPIGSTAAKAFSQPCDIRAGSAFCLTQTCPFTRPPYTPLRPALDSVCGETVVRCQCLHLTPLHSQMLSAAYLTFQFPACRPALELHLEC